MPAARTDRDPPRIVLWWEELHLAVQIAVVLPLAVFGMYVLHVTLLNQPTGRGLGYGLFWGVVLAFGIIGSTRAERARREARRAGDDTPGRMRL